MEQIFSVQQISGTSLSYGSRFAIFFVLRYRAGDRRHIAVIFMAHYYSMNGLPIPQRQNKIPRNKHWNGMVCACVSESMCGLMTWGWRKQLCTQRLSNINSSSKATFWDEWWNGCGIFSPIFYKIVSFAVIWREKWCITGMLWRTDPDFHSTTPPHI